MKKTVISTIFLLSLALAISLSAMFLRAKSVALGMECLLAILISVIMFKMIKTAKYKVFRYALCFASIGMATFALENLARYLGLLKWVWKANWTAIPEAFILLSVVFLLSGVKNRISTRSVLFDFLSIGGIWCFTVYILFVANHSIPFTALPDITRILFLNIFINIFSLAIILIILFFSIEKKYRLYLVIILLGATLFTITDILRLAHAVVFNAGDDDILRMLTSLSFIITLTGISIGITHPQEIYAHRETPSPLRGFFIAGKSIIVLLAPILVYLTHPSFIGEVFVLISAVVAYLFISESIRIYNLRKENLAKQKADNRYLEEQVASRSEELRQKREMLEQISNYDSVTGLFNRQYFQTRLSEMVDALNEGEELVLYYIDMDKFKSINDTYGHAIGDLVLRELGVRINKVRGEEGLKARLGGDEFTLVFKVQKGTDFLSSTMRALQSVVESEITVGELQFKLAMSVGVTIYPTDADSTETLLRNADIAMYRAKELGNNQFFYYNAIFGETVNQRNELALLLQNADIRRDFKLYYQPLLDCDGRLTGVEAFIRWNAQNRGWVSPEEFIPLAEEIGVIVALGNWILENTAQQIRDWNRRYRTQLKMSVNLSYRQLNVSDFVETLLEDLRRYGVEASLFDLEIKESVATNPDLVNATVLRLVNEGIRVSIDEFGTGYSSLNELARLKIHRLKISRDLIANIGENEREKAILKAVVKLAKVMGFEVYIKGVETRKQYEILKEMDVDGMQGYYFTNPLSADEFETTYLKIK